MRSQGLAPGAPRTCCGPGMWMCEPRVMGVLGRACLASTGLGKRDQNPRLRSSRAVRWVSFGQPAQGRGLRALSHAEEDLTSKAC